MHHIHQSIFKYTMLCIGLSFLNLLLASWNPLCFAYCSKACSLAGLNIHVYCLSIYRGLTGGVAQSHIFKECLEIDEKGKPYVNPEKVRVFRGSLHPPKDCSVWQENDTLHFKWNYEAIRGSQTYRINIVVYDIDHVFVFKIAEEDMHTGEYSMLCDLLAYKKGPLYVYMGVVDTYTEELSDSVYVGTVE